LYTGKGPLSKTATISSALSDPLYALSESNATFGAAKKTALALPYKIAKGSARKRGRIFFQEHFHMAIYGFTNRLKK